VRLSHALGAEQVELHTGEYCHLCEPGQRERRDAELTRLVAAAELASSLGLEVAAGHGLTRHNVGPIVAIPSVTEVNIGHAVIADALFLGLGQAVKELREAIARHANA
jgi:pyridoxine 5-phosphate synthase